MKTTVYILFLVLFNITFAQISDFSDIDFKKADDNAMLFKGLGLNNLPTLSYNLTHNLETDVEKFRAIYKWVCSNITGDISQHQKVSRKRKKLLNDSIAFLNWNKKHLKVALKKLLNHKKTMCTGYAYLVKELCFLANIECEIIDGYGRTLDANVDDLNPNHSWNAVKLNGKWYLCDATWSSGYSLNNIFIADYNDGYFLTDPNLFGKNHYPLDEKWLLTNSTTKSIFLTSPLVYGETFKYQLIPLHPNKLYLETTNGMEILFSYKILKDFINKEINLVRYVGNKERTLNIENLNINPDRITFNYTFTKNGFYDVHLKIGNDIVTSYTIHVNKS